MRNVLGSSVLLALSSALALGCSCSALIDIPCEQGYVACDRQCVRVDDDPLNCGGCGVVCASGVCTAGTCEGGEVADASWAPGDGSTTPDAGPAPDHDAGVVPVGDAEVDASQGDADATTADAWSSSEDAASAETDAWSEPGSDAGTSVDPDAAMTVEDAAVATDDGGAVPICDLGQTLCGRDCVLLGSDAMHCGSCETVCAPSEVCSGGACVASCEPGLTPCGRDCIDTTSSPSNCGGCGVVCPTGLCVSSACVSGYAGHLVVIGHDYAQSLPPMDALLENALHLSSSPMPRVLTYRGAVGAPSAAGIDASLAGARATFTVDTSDPSVVPALLAENDVLLVYPQPDASVEQLEDMGTAWSRALATFLVGGGTIVALDAPPVELEEDSAGAVAWLSAAGLVSSVTRRSATGEVLTVVAPADALAVGLPLAYRAQIESVRWFDPDLPTVVTASTGAVVMHRTVVP